MSNIAPDVMFPSSLTTAVARWNYDTSIKKVAPKVLKWKGLTVEIARELWLAREYFRNQQGQRKDPDADDYIAYSWSDYCEAIGISRQTANGWLRNFVPGELADGGSDVMLDNPVQKQIASYDDRGARESRIAEFRETGKRPGGWNEGDEKELKRRVANERFEALTEKYRKGKLGGVTVKPRTDYFSDAMGRVKEIKKFKLSSRDEMIAQMEIFEAIKAYLAAFSDIDTRLLAAFNLGLAVKNIVNEIAELKNQMDELSAGEIISEDMGNE